MEHSGRIQTDFHVADCGTARPVKKEVVERIPYPQPQSAQPIALGSASRPRRRHSHSSTGGNRAGRGEPSPIKIALHAEHEPTAICVVDTERATDKAAIAIEVASRKTGIGPITRTENIAPVDAKIDTPQSIGRVK